MVLLARDRGSRRAPCAHSLWLLSQHLWMVLKTGRIETVIERQESKRMFLIRSVHHIVDVRVCIEVVDARIFLARKMVARKHERELVDPASHLTFAQRPFQVASQKTQE